MSDREIRYPEAEAWKVAEPLALALRQVCERVEIVGSLRRRKPLVGDIELLFIPRKGTRQVDFFSSGQYSLADELIEAWLRDGLISKRPSKDGRFAWGEKNKLAIHVESGIPLDLFATTEPNWWNSLVCRTGGKQNNLDIAMAAQRKGWSFEAFGSGFQKTTGPGHYETTSEEDVFRFVGIPFAPPNRRR